MYLNLKIMDLSELEFCEKFEREVNMLEILIILKDSWTESGLLLLNNTEKWCNKAMYKYCELTDTPKP